jgi:toxin ParE1/3/4
VRVVFTPLADRHIGKLHNYIAKQSGDARADAFIDRIITYCDQFATFPLRGTPRDDLLAGLRTIGFERSVTIAFVVSPDTVVIEGIYCGGQDYEANYRSRD